MTISSLNQSIFITFYDNKLSFGIHDQSINNFSLETKAISEQNCAILLSRSVSSKYVSAGIKIYDEIEGSLNVHFILSSNKYVSSNSMFQNCSYKIALW